MLNQPLCQVVLSNKLIYQPPDLCTSFLVLLHCFYFHIVFRFGCVCVHSCIKTVKVKGDRTLLWFRLWATCFAWNFSHRAHEDQRGLRLLLRLLVVMTVPEIIKMWALLHLPTTTVAVVVQPPGARAGKKRGVNLKYYITKYQQYLVV